jgi:flagellar biogenesis protein FliO
MNSTPAPFWVDLLWMIGGLAVTLGLLWGAMRFLAPRLRRWHGHTESAVKVVARCPLEPRKTLYVVEAGSQTLLIGASESGLNLISQLNVEARTETTPVADAPSFRELMKRRAS